ncbi:MAG TPA: MarR family transcriptional regulator, partial [Mesotoga infera]|nr:MarR family transcriptional regulator [Mesotoga infera]
GEVLDVLKESEHESFYLYGAGIIGGILADVLRTEGIKIIGFIDDSAAKQNGTFHDLHVFSPEKVDGRDDTAVIVASFRHANHIVKNARDRGLDNVMVFTISKLGKVELEQIE